MRLPKTVVKAFFLLVIVATGYACSGPTAPTAMAEGALSQCNIQPNYLNSSLPPEGGTARLMRWRDFPVTFSVDTSSLPAHLQHVYTEAAAAASHAWSQATDDRIGQLRNAGPGSQITVRFVGPGVISTAGQALVEGQGSFITRATITLQRLQSDDGLVQSGQTTTVVGKVSNQLAHEFGHALGIVMHSPHGTDLMHPTGNYSLGVANEAPRQFITDADRNSLLSAYCN